MWLRKFAYMLLASTSAFTFTFVSAFGGSEDYILPCTTAGAVLDFLAGLISACRNGMYSYPVVPAGLDFNRIVASTASTAAPDSVIRASCSAIIRIPGVARGRQFVFFGPFAAAVGALFIGSAGVCTIRML